VTTTITNPNYSGGATNIAVGTNSTPVVDPLSYTHSSSLKSYGRDDMYTFSGASLVAIRPSRMKLHNTNFPYNSLSYSIKYVIASMNVYKAIPDAVSNTIYLGNPANIGSNDPAITPNPGLWQLIATLTTPEEKIIGIPIGRKTIGQNPTLAATNAVSYYVSLPPFYKYRCVTTNSLITPYNYNLLTTNNIHTVYLEYNESTNVFHPFAPLVQIEDVMGNNLNITHNDIYVNDITFTHLQPKTMLDLVTTPNATVHGIQVPGVHLNIQLSTGVYNSNTNQTEIYDGPITSLPSTLDIIDNLIVFRNRETNGSINFSVAQIPSNIGYGTGPNSYQELFRTTDPTYYYNIDFNIGNVGWFNNNSPVTYFNAAANGLSATLYTVIDVNDSVTKFNSRRVYRYDSLTPVNINTNPLFENITLIFNSSRYYYDVPVTRPNNPWEYSNLLAYTTVPLPSWTLDTTFSEQVYVSWSFQDAVTSANMTTDLFHIENEGLKWVLINLLPFQTFKNQFGLTVSEISWDGSVYTPMIATRAVQIQPLITSPALTGSNFQIEQYSMNQSVTYN
jgi:hypothetical protein